MLPRDQIVIVNFGGPGRRLQGLLAGQVEAATLLDPEIPIAEARGLRRLAMGEFKTLFWAHEGLEPGVLAGYLRALRRADQDLRNSPDTYMPLWARNAPRELHGDYDYRTFGLGDLLFFAPYSRQEFDEAIAFAETWGLTGYLQSRQDDDLASPVTIFGGSGRTGEGRVPRAWVWRRALRLDAGSRRGGVPTGGRRNAG